MREHEPVFYDRENDIYGIALHADIMAISKDSESFCSGRGFRPDAPNLPMMINMDRPEHMTRRNLVNSGFTLRKVALLEPRIRELCGQIIEELLLRIPDLRLASDTPPRRHPAAFATGLESLPLRLAGDVRG